ncbi:MgtC/SapB family protein [Stenotrophomonas sp. YIM B06876]|uniref:MgtC/SapB family protein n=1 Tax=Stenotrophomonas sp. YIM B06876 TaxID=3060211 RepID=UPI00273A14EE|nr:MgtC/SapB family protein [Stenotrophomonas sp. YIM B06876]
MIQWWEVGLRLLLAALLGSVIGINRGRLEWAAGLRTHMLVCVGSALAIIVSAYGFADVLQQPHMMLDPSRIAAQVISGVGFLGAGTILFLQREQVIRGLTTAAGLWAVASIGLAAGAGLYAAAGMATALLWAILALLKPLEQRYLHRNSIGNGLRVTLARGSSLARLESAIADFHLPVKRISLKRRDDSEDLVEIHCDAQLPRARLLEVADQLADLQGITSVGMLEPPAHR